MVVSSADIDAVGDYAIRLVDEGSWQAHVETIADGFGMPLDLVESVIPATLASSRDYAEFNAYLDGIVVSTSARVRCCCQWRWCRRR